MNKVEILQSAFRKIGILSLNQTINDEQYAEGSRELDSLIRRFNSESDLESTAVEIIPITETTVLKGIDGNSYSCTKTHELTLNTMPVIGDDYQEYFEENADASDEDFGSEVIGTDGAVYLCSKNHFSEFAKNPVSGSKKEEYWRQVSPVDTYSLTTGDIYTLINTSSLPIDTSRTREAWQIGQEYHSKVGQGMINRLDLHLPDNMLEEIEVSLLEADLYLHDLQKLDKLEMFQLAKDYSSSIASFPEYYEVDNYTKKISLLPEPDPEFNFSLKILGNVDIFSGEDVPPVWCDALIYGVAEKLAENYALPMNERQILSMKAREEKEQALYFNDKDRFMRGI